MSAAAPLPLPDEQSYRRLLERLPTAVYMCDVQGRITLYNAAAVALWGREPEIERDLWCGSWRIYRPDGSAVSADSCPMAVALREGRAVTGEEVVIERPDGTRRNVMSHPEPVRDQFGAVVGAINMPVDITERRQAEATQALLASIVTSSDDAIISKTLDGTITSWNTGAQRMFGYTAEEAVGRSIMMLIPPERLNEETEILGRLRRGERTEHFETMRLARDGRQVAISLSVSPVRDREGRIIGAAKLARNITDSRQAEDARALLASIVASSDDAVISKTLEGMITSWNAGAQRTFGYTAEEAVGRSITMLIPPERLNEETEILGRLRVGDRIDHFETVRVAKDGRRLTVSLSVSPVHDGQGRIIGAAKIARDITRQKLVERALFESEEQYRTLAESMPFVVWQTDASGSTRYANRFLQEYSGWTPEELRTQDGWLLVHPGDRSAMQERFAYSARTGESFRGAQRLRRNDGAWRWFEVAAEAVRDADGCITRWVGAAIDIEDRRKAESCLAAVRDDLALQVAGLTRLHELSTALAATRDMSSALHAVLGAIADLHGTNRGLLSLFDPSTGELFEGASLRFDEAALRRLARLKPGPVAGACGTCFYTGRRVIVEDTEADPCFAEYRAAARELGFRAVHSTPILTRLGEVLGVLSVQFDSPRRPTEREIQFADMCARLAADAIGAARAEAELNSHREHLEHMVIERTRELEESHQRLRLSERMALLGTLSAGLGHDMGNLLMPVRVRIESLEKAGLDPALAEDVRAIKTSAEYLQRLSSGLRLLALDPERARRGDAIEIGSWWSDAQPVFRNGLARGMSLVGQIPEEPCWTEIARPALTQAVFNLIQNAGDALKVQGSGVVTVSVRADDHHVWISVSDDGPGMTEAVRQRCMEPFFTTKARGISTGLGLVLVGGLVRDAGGTIDVASEPGRGTTVTITLARAHPEVVAPGAGARNRTGRLAMVSLQDARMRLFVVSELGSLAFEVLSDAALGMDHQPEVVVLDRADEHADRYLRQGARVVLLADSDLNRPGVTALGVRPSVGTIRQALRDAAGREPAEAITL